MSVNTQLREALLAIPELVAIVGDKVYELRVPQKDDGSGEPDLPFVWFAQGGIARARTLNDEAGQQPFSTQFDIECAAVDVAQALQLVAIARDGLDKPFPAGFGSGTANAVMVEDHDDDYTFRNPMADSGVAVGSLNVEIYP